MALKIINKGSIKKVSHINRLRREVNLLRLLDHPHIVKLFDVVVRRFQQMNWDISSPFLKGNIRGNSSGDGVCLWWRSFRLCDRKQEAVGGYDPETLPAIGVRSHVLS